LKAANRAGARFAVIIGEEELAAQQAAVRSLEDSHQTLVALAELPSWLKERS
jgi:histidyl-tRNA synthetase